MISEDRRVRWFYLASLMAPIPLRNLFKIACSMAQVAPERKVHLVVGCEGHFLQDVRRLQHEDHTLRMLGVPRLSKTVWSRPKAAKHSRAKPSSEINEKSTNDRYPRLQLIDEFIASKSMAPGMNKAHSPAGNYVVVGEALACKINM